MKNMKNFISNNDVEFINIDSGLYDDTRKCPNCIYTYENRNDISSDENTERSKHICVVEKVNSRKSFKVFYSKSSSNPALAGKEYKPTGENMLVMNNDGIFFVYNGAQYYPSITPLSVIIGNYDIVWD